MYQRKDAFYQRAKRQGYRSRAAYKLLELQTRAQILRKGDAVIDLGAWPGGWLQVAAELVGRKGRVLGVDIVPIDPLPAPQIAIVRADVADVAFPAVALDLLGRRADVVLSDLAPKISGIAPRDTARAAELAAAARRIAAATLGPGGILVVKTFGGAGAESERAALRDAYRSVRMIGLTATRKGSSEIYLVAAGFRGEDTSRPEASHRSEPRSRGS